MYLKRTIAGVISVIFFTIYFGSCSFETKTIEPYIIQVDSIVAPDTVTPKTVFEIRLLGIVGPSSCYSLEKVYVFVTEQKDISVEARGTFRYDGTPCADGVVYLDTTVETNVPTSGTYTIKALQQDNTYLVKKLIAR
jgi:hypothetical protein